MQSKTKKQNTGYTIIETMIAVSLFIVVVMAGMGALLNANLLHGKSQNMRSIMDNLSFIMEDMSKNLRTGSDYHCFSGTVPSGSPDPQSCDDGGTGISFKSHPDEEQWVYYKDVTANGFGIFKKVGTADAVQLTPDEVVIDNSVSPFSVLGAEPYLSSCTSPSDCQQPFVTIRLVGKIRLKEGVETPFSLQTSVSQRMIDIWVNF